MALKAKALGNALANKLRGFEDKTNQMESPQNMPAPPEEALPAEPGLETMPEEMPTEQMGAPVDVPATMIPDAMQGDTYVVEAVSPESVTLVKQ
jgi:hypothetical protein